LPEKPFFYSLCNAKYVRFIGKTPVKPSNSNR
jgi:hypothetical protein